MQKYAYLVIHNNVVCGTRIVELGLTEEEYKDLPQEEQELAVAQAAWEYADVYPEEEDGHVFMTVTLGLVGCDTQIDTDFENMKEWEGLDSEEQESIIRECFWEAVDCHVVFEENDAKAERWTTWGFAGDK